MNTLKRTEYLGDREGRNYEVSLDDPRIIAMKIAGKWQEVLYKEQPAKIQHKIDKALDSFEDGYNRLTEVNGVWYEYSIEYESIAIARKAYNVN